MLKAKKTFNTNIKDRDITNSGFQVKYKFPDHLFDPHKRGSFFVVRKVQLIEGAVFYEATGQHFDINGFKAGFYICKKCKRGCFQVQVSR